MMKLSVTANSEYKKKMYYCCSSSCLSLFFYAEAVLAEPHMGLMRDKIPNYRLWSNCLKGYYNYYDSSTSTKREHLFPFLMLTKKIRTKRANQIVHFLPKSSLKNMTKRFKTLRPLCQHDKMSIRTLPCRIKVKICNDKTIFL